MSSSFDVASKSKKSSESLGFFLALKTPHIEPTDTLIISIYLSLINGFQVNSLNKLSP